MGETTITIKKKDDTPQGQSRQQLARKGINGDTRLAHVNPYEEMLLKALGGVGTRNPRTGLKQFYTPGSNFTNDIGSWYESAFGREADPSGLAYWQGQDAGDMTDDQLWNSFLNAGNNETYTGWTPTVAGTSTGVDFPTDLYPTSTATSTSSGNSSSQNVSGNQAYNVSNNQSTNTGMSKSQSTNRSRSGLADNYITQLLNSVVPALVSRVDNMDANYDEYANQALGAYQTLMNNAIRKNIPTAIASLANRGILNSTEGQGVLGNVYSAAMTDAADKGYTTAMQAALAKANIPSILAQIAQLGQVTESEGQSTSLGTNYGQSTGSGYGTSSGYGYGTSNSTNSSNSNSSTANPLAPYELLANMIMAQY